MKSNSIIKNTIKNKSNNKRVKSYHYNDLNYGRKILHISIGLGLFYLIYKGFLTPYMLFWLLILSGAISFIQKYYNLPIITFLIKRFGKPSEKRFPGKGFILMLMGMLITLKLFPIQIAYAAIIIQIFGDPLTHLLSLMFPKPRFKVKKTKTIFGVLLAIAITTYLASFFINWIFALTGVVVSLIFELFEIKIEDQVLDDNIMIPIVAGTSMLILLYNF